MWWRFPSLELLVCSNCCYFCDEAYPSSKRWYFHLVFHCCSGFIRSVILWCYGRFIKPPWGIVFKSKTQFVTSVLDLCFPNFVPSCTPNSPISSPVESSSSPRGLLSSAVMTKKSRNWRRRKKEKKKLISEINKNNLKFIDRFLNWWII